jgi:hypothetical protein
MEGWREMKPPDQQSLQGIKHGHRIDLHIYEKEQQICKLLQLEETTESWLKLTNKVVLLKFSKSLQNYETTKVAPCPLKSLLNHETPRWCIMVSEISWELCSTQMMRHGVWNLLWIMKHPDDASCCLRKSLQNHVTPWDAHYLKSLSEIMKLPRCMVCEWLPDLSSVKSQVNAGGREEGDADGKEIINYTW